MSGKSAKFGPQLSACLIVRNEEAVLERCLASLQGLADEIIVVDTGSEDRTRSIAARMGAKLGAFEWRDDFAAARNAALKLAKGRWVLSIDADEWIPSVNVSQFIRDRVSQDRSEAYIVRVFSPVTQRSMLGTTRLFPREDAHWEYRLHEQVRLSKGVRRLANPDFWFGHSGYDEATEERGARADRNLPMLQRILSEEAPDSREYRHAQIYWCRSLRPPYDEAAIDMLETNIRLAIGFDELNHQLLTLKLYKFLIENNRFAELLDINRRVMSHGAHGPLPYFALAIHAVGEQRHEEARQAFRRCLQEQDMVDVRQRLAPMFANLQRELFVSP